jgi:hypothetical protein
MDPNLTWLNPGHTLISYFTNTYSIVISQSVPMFTTWPVPFILINIFYTYSTCPTRIQRPVYFILLVLTILKQALSSWKYRLLKQDAVQCNISWVTTRFGRVKAMLHQGGWISSYIFHSYCANWVKLCMKTLIYQYWAFTNFGKIGAGEVLSTYDSK